MVSRIVYRLNTGFNRFASGVASIIVVVVVVVVVIVIDGLSQVDKCQVDEVSI